MAPAVIQVRAYLPCRGLLRAIVFGCSVVAMLPPLRRPAWALGVAVVTRWPIRTEVVR